MDNEKNVNITITENQEQPSLDLGPQRLHYVASVAIPQAYLTLISVLQGIAFGVLLIGLPFPQGKAFDELWHFFIQQYIYLPVIRILTSDGHPGARVV